MANKNSIDKKKHGLIKAREAILIIQQQKAFMGISKSIIDIFIEVQKFKKNIKDKKNKKDKTKNISK